ncbi:MAG: hypothetical protein EOM67_10590 [Spirochaetia bacterium]|nr:hypothetical protein [Spirochaetia bacterium]
MSIESENHKPRLIAIVLIIFILLLVDLIIQVAIYQQLIIDIQIAEARLGMRTIEVSVLDFFKRFYFPLHSPRMVNILLKK